MHISLIGTGSDSRHIAHGRQVKNTSSSIPWSAALSRYCPLTLHAQTGGQGVLGEEFVHPVGWRRAVSRYCCICSNVFSPVDRNHFKSAADTPRKDRMAFTQDFPLKILVSPPYATATYTSNAEHCISFSMQLMNDCFQLGWVITIWNCSVWYQDTCLVNTNSCMSTERWTYVIPMSTSDLCMYESVVRMVSGWEDGASIIGTNM